MTTQTARPAVSMKNWDQVLTKVGGVIEQSLATVDRRLRDHDALAANRPGEGLARHLQGLEERLKTARQLVDETDQALADREKVLRDYLNNVENLRRKLAKWASGATS